MPDGFTPSSLALFDQQVTLLCSRYTLKGVNVLVHCRGESPFFRLSQYPADIRKVLNENVIHGE